jgi:hypothetical protein
MNLAVAKNLGLRGNKLETQEIVVWHCVLCEFIHHNRQTMREHYKKQHHKVMCRCGLCTDITHSRYNYCEDCVMGRCCNCGAGTRIR